MKAIDVIITIGCILEAILIVMQLRDGENPFRIFDNEQER